MNNQDCTICTRYQKCNKVCQVPKFKESEVLMIVGDSPSKESDNGLTAMSGKYEILKSVLKQVLKVDFDKIYFTHAVKCYDPDLITDNQIESCNDYLAEEINLVKPKVILTLGKTATLGLLEEKDFKGANFNKITGKKYHQIDNETKLEFTVIPVYSPKYISFNKGALKQWAKDIYTAYNLATDTEVVFEQTKIQIVDTPELLLDLIQHTKTSGWMSHDFETTGLDTFAEDFKLTCFSLSFQHGSSWVIPLHHKDSPLLETYKGYLELVNRELLQDPNVIKIAHNLQYEKDCWATLGVKSFRGRIIDTMLQHYLLYNDKPHGLKMIIPDYFPEYDGYDMEVSKHNWDNVPYNILVNYCGIDSDLTLRLAVQFENELLQQPRLYDIFRNLLMPALQTYWAAHNAGIEIDVDYLEDAIIEVDKLIAVQDGILREIPTVYKYDLHRTEEEQEALIKSLEGKYKVAEDKWVVSTDKMRATGEAKIQAWYEGQFNKDIDDDVLENKRTEKLHKLEEKLCKRIEGSVRMNNYLKQISDIKAGIIQPIEPLNFGSHTQLGGLLYDKQGFGMKKPIDWKTGKEGGTGVAILKDFEGVEVVEFVDSLLLLRSLNKTQSTYLRGIQKLVDNNNRIHPSFLLHGTSTGRLACVAESTLLKTDLGLIAIGDLIPDGYGIIELDKEINVLTHTGEYQRITHGINKGYEQMYEVELENGAIIECTEEHKFLTNEGWLTLKNILSLRSKRTIKIKYEINHI